MAWRRALLPAIACLTLGVFASPALGATKFHARIGGALGLFPPYSGDGTFGAQDIAPGALGPVVYHGGQVMTGGVTIHAIFWAPPGYSFQGSPGTGIPTYRGMIEQFFTDVAAGSTGTSGGPCTTSTCNMFTVEPQYAQGQTPGTVTPGQNTVHFNTATDSITDTDPYPPKSQQCASPQNTATCLTDPEVQAEVKHIISTSGGSTGLHDIWYVFTPPDVDECILPGECETNAYGGYHSLSHDGSGVAIYAYTGDPIVETRRVNNPGNDPEGNPDAENVVDIAAHEVNEAMTDPEGVGWMDPNGFEMGDKCEFGPQFGTPLGHAPNGSPYNQVINGHKYLIQEMWANFDNNGNPDCVQATTNTSNDLPLPQVYMSQYSQSVSGNTEKAGGGSVTVSLVRNGPSGPVTVAQGNGAIASDGSWGPVSLAPHAIGDDRDEIDVDYSGASAPSVSHQVILTGNGGNPFIEGGWMGWTDMDNGSCLTNNPGGPCLTGTDVPSGSSSLTLAPCFQTGVLSSNAFPSESPTDFCSTQLDSATVPLGGATPADAFNWGSLDNRGFQDPNLPTANPDGALVNLTVPIGEPDAVSSFPNPMPTFTPTGFPTCSADLEAQSVSCSGLVPGSNYTMTDNGTAHSATADGGGNATASFPVKRGDTVTLSNGSRNLTTLHVSNLRVDITGEQTVLSGGSCSPDQYFAAPLSSAPTNLSAGFPTALAGGSALTDTICPSSGDATGFPSSPLAQTDELSGGSTTTEVPDIEDTSPMEAETVYGNFVAMAETGFPGPNNTVTPADSTSTVGLTIAPAGGGASVFTSPNVDTASGVPVNGLKPGSYKATWTLTDANGDTRTVTTRFIEQPGSKSGKKKVKPKVRCKNADHGKKVKCSVSYPKINGQKPSGKVQMRLTRGGHVVALGHGRVKKGHAKLTMRVRKHVTSGRWSATLVLRQSHQASITSKVHPRMN